MNMMRGMNRPAPAMTTNQHLRELVDATALPLAVVLTLFNRGLGAAAVPESRWKSFLAQPGQAHFQVVPDELLAHAQRQLTKLSAQRIG
jgi:hypothetical protein